MKSKDHNLPIYTPTLKSNVICKRRTCGCDTWELLPPSTETFRTGCLWLRLESETSLHVVSDLWLFKGGLVSYRLFRLFCIMPAQSRYLEKKATASTLYRPCSWLKLFTYESFRWTRIRWEVWPQVANQTMADYQSYDRCWSTSCTSMPLVRMSSTKPRFSYVSQRLSLVQRVG